MRFDFLRVRQARDRSLIVAKAYSTGGDYSQQQGNGFMDPDFSPEGDGPVYQPAATEVYEVC